MTTTESATAIRNTATIERGERSGQPLLTRRGAQLLAERVADIRLRQIPEQIPLLVEHDRDERNVAQYEQLLEEADALDAFLASAEFIDVRRAAFDGHVGLGMKVQVRLTDGTTEWIQPVHPREAVLDDERISVTSPLGVALIGSQLGDEVIVEAPVGRWTCRIVAVEFDDGAVTSARASGKVAGR